MALRFVDSFAGYATANLTQRYDIADTSGTQIVNAGSSPTPPPARTGLQSLSGIYSTYVGKLMAGAPSALIQGVAYYDPNVASNAINPIFVLTDAAGNPMIGLYALNTGALRVRTLGLSAYGDVNSLTLGTSASGVLPRNGFYFVEWKVTCSTTATGSVTVYVGGVAVLTLTNVITSNTTLQATSATIGYAVLGSQFDGSSSNGGWYANDYYIADTSGTANNAPLGDIRVQALYPAAPGQQTQWTKNGGAAADWSSVNASPPGTNYVSSATVANTDAYMLTGLPTVAVIKAVQVSINSRKDDAGARSIGIGLGNGSTEVIDAGHVQATSQKYYSAPYDTNPLTSAAWQPADFPSLQAVIKVVA